ncbi:hypothetical protein P879_00241 [Paragonimus westermani]|uniref:KASH domain-containing protein n=1 Tax=Paragonimus westermani TaxID=34504 RepID=A0A8T0DS80_9TREM|nr:hypothetical protein P879_00241 [Paragonimus westermani]
MQPEKWDDTCFADRNVTNVSPMERLLISWQSQEKHEYFMEQANQKCSHQTNEFARRLAQLSSDLSEIFMFLQKDIQLERNTLMYTVAELILCFFFTSGSSFQHRSRQLIKLWDSLTQLRIEWTALFWDGRSVDSLGRFIQPNPLLHLSYDTHMELLSQTCLIANDRLGQLAKQSREQLTSFKPPLHLITSLTSEVHQLSDRLTRIAPGQSIFPGQSSCIEHSRLIDMTNLNVIVRQVTLDLEWWREVTHLDLVHLLRQLRMLREVNNVFWITQEQNPDNIKLDKRISKLQSDVRQILLQGNSRAKHMAFCRNDLLYLNNHLRSFHLRAGHFCCPSDLPLTKYHSEMSDEMKTSLIHTICSSLQNGLKLQIVCTLARWHHRMCYPQPQTGQCNLLGDYLRAHVHQLVTVLKTIQLSIRLTTQTLDDFRNLDERTQAWLESWEHTLNEGHMSRDGLESVLPEFNRKLEKFLCQHGANSPLAVCTNKIVPADAFRSTCTDICDRSFWTGTLSNPHAAFEDRPVRTVERAHHMLEQGRRVLTVLEQNKAWLKQAHQLFEILQTQPSSPTEHVNHDGPHILSDLCTELKWLEQRWIGVVWNVSAVDKTHVHGLLTQMNSVRRQGEALYVELGLLDADEAPTDTLDPLTSIVSSPPSAVRNAIQFGFSTPVDAMESSKWSPVAHLKSRDSQVFVIETLSAKHSLDYCIRIVKSSYNTNDDFSVKSQYSTSINLRRSDSESIEVQNSTINLLRQLQRDFSKYDSRRWTARSLSCLHPAGPEFKLGSYQIVSPSEISNSLPDLLSATNNSSFASNMGEPHQADAVDPHLFIKPRRQLRRMVSDVLHSSEDLYNRRNARGYLRASQLCTPESHIVTYDLYDMDDDVSGSISSDHQQSDPTGYAEFLLRALKPPVSPRRPLVQITTSDGHRSSSQLNLFVDQSDHDGTSSVSPMRGIESPIIRRPKPRKRNHSLTSEAWLLRNPEGNGTLTIPEKTSPNLEETTLGLTSVAQHVDAPEACVLSETATRLRTQKMILQRGRMSTPKHTTTLSIGANPQMRHELYETVEYNYDLLSLMEQLYIFICVQPVDLTELILYATLPRNHLNVIHKLEAIPPHTHKIHSLSSQEDSVVDGHGNSPTTVDSLETYQPAELPEEEFFEEEVQPLSYDELGNSNCAPIQPVNSSLQSEQPSFADVCQPPSSLQSRTSSPIQSKEALVVDLHATFTPSRMEEPIFCDGFELVDQLNKLRKRALRMTAELSPDSSEEPELLSASCDQLRTFLGQLEAHHFRVHSFPFPCSGHSTDSIQESRLTVTWHQTILATKSWLDALRRAFACSTGIEKLIIEFQQHLNYAESRIRSVLQTPTHPVLSAATNQESDGLIWTDDLAESKSCDENREVESLSRVPTALRLLRVIRFRLSEWYSHLNLLLLNSETTNVLSAIAALNPTENSTELSAIASLSVSTDWLSKLMQLRSRVGTLFDDAERLLTEWSIRDRHTQPTHTDDRGGASVKVTSPTRCFSRSNRFRCNPKVWRGADDRSRRQGPVVAGASVLSNNVNNSIRKPNLETPQSVNYSDTDDNIEELVSVTSRSSASPVSDASEELLNFEQATDTSWTSEGIARSLAPSDNTSCTLSGALHTHSHQTTLLSVPQPIDQSSPLHRPIVTNQLHLTSSRQEAIQIFHRDTNRSQSEEFCSTPSTCKSSPETCTYQQSQTDSYMEESAILLGHNCSGEETALSVIQCSRLHNLQDFTKFYALKRNVSVILRKTASRFLPKRPRLWSVRNVNRGAPNVLEQAGDRISTFPVEQYNEIMHSIHPKHNQGVYDLMGMSRRTQPIQLWLPCFLRTVLFVSLLLAVFCFVIYWPFDGLPTSHERTSCSYRWLSGSWFQESIEVGPTRTLSKSWSHIAPPT